VESKLDQIASAIARAVQSCAADDREILLDRLCRDDDSLRATVMSMMGPAEDATHVIDMHSASSASSGRGLGVARARRIRSTGDLSGERVGPYELLRRIGKGGMGSVYAARRVDHEFRRTVAVKLVKPGMETEEIVQRFRNERQVLAGLNHPNIARLLDGGSEEGVPYLVMEYVEGTQIDTYCAAHRLSVKERLNLFLSVCSAVQYAHQSLVVHRDLKPSNILVTADGTPKLLDFGIAKVLSPELGDQAMTKASERPMTPEYASPEQVRGEPVTTGSDVYALGILLYQLLTDVHPLRRLYEKHGFERAVLELDPEPPSVAARLRTPLNGSVTEGSVDKLVRRLSGDLDAIIMMALRKEPQRRYASVQHLADDIHRHLQGLPVKAHRDSFSYRAQKFVRRNSASVAAAAVIAVALATSSVVSLTFYKQAEVERRRAESRLTELRDLARFVLLNFEKISQLGITPARKAVVEKATQYLDRMANDRYIARDPGLAQELVEGYISVGNLQGNLYDANVGDRYAAERSYRRALELLESTGQSPLKTAEVQAQLADLLVATTPKSAVPVYEKAVKVFEQVQGDNTHRAKLANVLHRLAFAQAHSGDHPRALETHQRALAVALAWQEAEPGSTDARGAIARAELHAGQILAQMGDVEHGLALMQRGFETRKQLAAVLSSANRKRMVANAAGMLGDVLRDAGRHEEALAHYRQALEICEANLASDPRNAQSQRDVITYAARLGRYAALSGRRAEGRQSTQRALQLLLPLVNVPDAPPADLYQYAWILLTTPYTELHNSERAREIAVQLTTGKRGEEPANLNLLALAYAKTGRPAEAVAIEERALELIPSDAGSNLRKELEENLASFRSAAAKTFSR
jgi:non-specific serine/threonine protein kinase/serine/threonine-protein kinase